MLIILVLVALVAALICVASYASEKHVKSPLVPALVFLIALGGILLVNLVTSTN